MKPPARKAGGAENPNPGLAGHFWSTWDALLTVLRGRGAGTSPARGHRQMGVTESLRWVPHCPPGSSAAGNTATGSSRSQVCRVSPGAASASPARPDFGGCFTPRFDASLLQSRRHLLDELGSLLREGLDTRVTLPVVRGGPRVGTPVTGRGPQLCSGSQETRGWTRPTHA